MSNKFYLNDDDKNKEKKMSQEEMTEQELQKLNAEAGDYLSKFFKEQDTTDANSKSASTKDVTKSVAKGLGAFLLGSAISGGPIQFAINATVTNVLLSKNMLPINKLFDEIDSLAFKVLTPEVWLSKLAVDAYNKIDIKTYYKNAVEAINNYWKKDERKQALYHEALIKMIAIVKILQEKNARNEAEIGYLQRLVTQFASALNQGFQREGMKNV